ncbi:hypothetical protein OAC89_03075 [Deltaproteobacteria bacterium]|nr:hypothetical protein [Deltaproteobacteria bacterium]
MTDIDQLIEADEENCKQSLKLFNHFDPSLIISFDDASNLFTTFSRSFGHGARDDDTQSSISELAKKGGLTESGFKDVLNGRKPSKLADDQFEEIISNRNDYYSRRSRALLLLHAYRSYMYAATDIRRLRVGTALGLMRLEIESVALMSLFQGKNELAYTWFNLKGDQKGRTFFNKTKNDVSEFNKQFELTDEWNLASSVAQHSRFIGIVDGLSISRSSQSDRYTDNFSLAFQDFDPEKPEQLIVRALYILRTQAKLLIPLKLALPEVSDPLLLETRIPKFIKNIGLLYGKFQRQFPEFLTSIGFETKEKIA